MRRYSRLKDAHGLEGVELADLEQARAHAIRAIEELRHEDASAARDWSGWALDVADANSTVLFPLDLDSMP